MNDHVRNVQSRPSAVLGKAPISAAQISEGSRSGLGSDMDASLKSRSRGLKYCVQVSTPNGIVVR